MRITKNQLKQIIKEELQAVLSEARVPLALREGATEDIFRNYPDPEKWTYLDPELPDPFADANAKRAAKKAAAAKAAKKGLFSGLGKFLARVVSGPVGAAMTGAEIAGHAIDMGVGGDRAKYGKAKYGFGSEEDAYNSWAADTLKKTGERSPSYEQWLRIEAAAPGWDRKVVAKQVKAEMEMENPSELKLDTYGYGSDESQRWMHANEAYLSSIEAGSTVEEAEQAAFDAEMGAAPSSPA